MAGNKSEKWMTRETGSQLSAIARSALVPAEAAVTSKVATELICSYNWTSDKKPTIHVPGRAALWTGGDLPQIISPDSGRQFVDQDGSKSPKHPFESVFRALELQRPDYRFNDIDCLSNRNSLRKLLDFCSGIKAKNSFRINLYLVQNTLITERCEKNAVEFLRGSGMHGYGHNFERAFTKYAKGLGNSTSHHRILQYKLGDVNMVDACHDTKTENRTDELQVQGKPTEANIDLLNKGLSSLKLDSKDYKSHSPNTPSIMVNRKGNGTPQSLTAEIKTGKKSVSMSKILPQMWFGRTQTLIKGIHSEGEFHKIDIERVDLERWETDARNQLALRKLAGLIEQFRTIMKTTQNRAAIVVLHRHDPEKLKVLERKGDRQPLPKDVIAKFWSEK